MTLTAKQIEEVYFAIGRGQAVIEKNADGEDGVTIAVETGQEYAADYLIAEGMTLVGLGRFAGPLLAFLSILEPTKMGNGSLPRNDFILLPGLSNPKITLSGDTLLKQFLPPLSHFDPNYVETNHRHWTALHRAMYEGNVWRVKWLIDNGARVQADDLGHYPHQVATHPAIDPAAHDQIVRLVDPNYVETDGRHWTALHRAMYEGNVKRAQWLIDNGAKVQTDDLGHYPHQVATHPAIDPAAHDQIVRLVDPNYVETDGRHWTALHRAMYEGNVKRAQWLIDNGARVQTDDLGHYPHQVSTHPAIDPTAHDKIVRLVDPNYVETDHLHWTALHRAVYEGNINRVQWLLANDAIIEQDKNGLYPHQIAPYFTVSTETDSTIKRLLPAIPAPTPTSATGTQLASSASKPPYPTPTELIAERRRYGQEPFMAPDWHDKRAIRYFFDLKYGAEMLIEDTVHKYGLKDGERIIKGHIKYLGKAKENSSKTILEQAWNAYQESRVYANTQSTKHATTPIIPLPSTSGINGANPEVSAVPAKAHAPASPSISVRQLPALPGVKGRDQFFKPGPPPKAGQNRGCPAGHVLMPATAQHPKECYKLVMCK